MKYLLILALFISGCGECEFNMINGLCIDFNNFPVDEDLVFFTIAETENEINELYTDIDLNALLETNNITGKYVPEYTIKCDTDSWASGCYRPKERTIEVEFISNLYYSAYRCRSNYSILAHEILHAVLDMNELGGREDSNEHSHPVYTRGGVLSKVINKLTNRCIAKYRE